MPRCSTNAACRAACPPPATALSFAGGGSEPTVAHVTLARDKLVWRSRRCHTRQRAHLLLRTCVSCTPRGHAALHVSCT